MLKEYHLRRNVLFYAKRIASISVMTRFVMNHLPEKTVLNVCKNLATDQSVKSVTMISHTMPVRL